MVIWWDLVKVYRPLSEQWLKQVETSSLSWAFHPKLISTTLDMPALPILDTLQKMTNSLLVNVDIPIDTKRLKD